VWIRREVVAGRQSCLSSLLHPDRGGEDLDQEEDKDKEFGGEWAALYVMGVGWLSQSRRLRLRGLCGRVRPRDVVGR